MTEVTVSPSVAAISGQPTGLVLVAMVEPGRPLGTVLPERVLRVVQSGEAGRVEHLRLSAAEQARALPGLSGSHPSLLRDSVRLALAAGLPFVDVLALALPNAGRASLALPAVAEQVRSALQHLPGAVIVAPDLRLCEAAIVARFAHANALALPDAFQVLVLDAPFDHDVAAFARACEGVDAAVCRWSPGPWAASQSFRSSATWVGAMLARPGGLGRSLTGLTLPGLPGRAMPASRAEVLLRRVRSDGALPQIPGVVDVHSTGTGLAIMTEPSTRSVDNAWPLPALYAVKAVHRAILQQASAFVFRNVNAQNAVSLGTAVSTSLTRFVKLGLLSGPTDRVPEVEAAMIRDPGAPGLAVTVSAVLRPWMQKVRVQVGVTLGDRPSLVELR